MSTIQLNVSLVSQILAGYEPKEKLRHAFLKNNRFCSRWMNEVQDPGPESTEEIVASMRDRGEDKYTTVEKCLKSDLDSDFISIIRNEKIEDPVMQRKLEQAIGKERGKSREESALSALGGPVTDRQRYFQKYFMDFTLPDGREVPVILRGRVDGIMENKVVETKNRMHKLLLRIPSHEEVQVQLYLFLTELPEGLHIENYDNKSVITPIPPMDTDRIKEKVLQALETLFV